MIKPDNLEILKFKVVLASLCQSNYCKLFEFIFLKFGENRSIYQPYSVSLCACISVMTKIKEENTATCSY